MIKFCYKIILRFKSLLFNWMLNNYYLTIFILGVINIIIFYYLYNSYSCLELISLFGFTIFFIVLRYRKIDGKFIKSFLFKNVKIGIYILVSLILFYYLDSEF